ncbi:MAG: hypothetical protein ACKVOG_10340 [Rhodoglobus sp.]
MTARVWGFAGVGALGLAAMGVVSPASALPPVEGCGDAPAGATLTKTDGVCQLDFPVGTYNWTVPAGLTSLFAVIVGGGGGAYADGSSAGYSGDGGAVLYADLTAAAAGSTATIVAGDAGASGDEPTDGENSSVTAGSTTTAPGGFAGGFIGNYCIINGDFSVYVGNGDGSGGAADLGGDCSVDLGPGVNPFDGDLDTYGMAVPSIFASLNAALGAGGRVLETPDALTPDVDLAGTGQGASVFYVSGDPSSIPDFNETAGSGRVILRYTVGALAATGTDAIAPLGVGAVLAALGATLFAVSRRRTRSES